jgi:hypothetical protein
MTTAEMVYAQYEKGKRVRVIKCNSYKKYDYTGKLGTVRSSSSQYGKIYVKLDNEWNPYSDTGLFYFKPYELSLLNDNTTDIEEENNMENITNYLNIAKISFVDGNDSRTFDYANFEPTLKKGDLCVVKSAHHGLGLAKVVEIVDRNDIQTPREIVAKVDTQDYDFRVASRKDAAELKAKMKERAKQLQDIALYQMLAEKDPEMQELLARYQSIPKL